MLWRLVSGVRLFACGEVVLLAVRQVAVVQDVLRRLDQLPEPWNQGQDEQHRAELSQEVAEAEAHRPQRSISVHELPLCGQSDRWSLAGRRADPGPSGRASLQSGWTRPRTSVDLTILLI